MLIQLDDFDSTNLKFELNIVFKIVEIEIAETAIESARRCGDGL